MRRVRAGTHGSAFWAHQSALRASGHAQGHFRCAPECAACERARAEPHSERARMRRVRAGARGSVVGARQSAPRASGRARRRFRTRQGAPSASGHARERTQGAPQRAACERARTEALS
eukprot:9128263-Pyramimonas_sp.AAC.1